MARGPQGKKHLLTEADVQLIETASGFGLTNEEIGKLLRGMSKKTFERRIKDSPKKLVEMIADARDRGRAKAKLNVSRVAYEMATSGKFPQMTLGWLKYQGGWTEPERADDFCPSMSVSIQNNNAPQLPRRVNNEERAALICEVLGLPPGQDDFTGRQAVDDDATDKE